MKKTLVVLFVLVSIVMGTVGCFGKSMDRQRKEADQAFLEAAKGAYLESDGNPLGLFLGKIVIKKMSSIAWVAKANSDGCIIFQVPVALPDGLEMQLNLVREKKGDGYDQWLVGHGENGVTSIYTSNNWMVEDDQPMKPEVAIRKKLGLLTEAFGAIRKDVSGYMIFDYIR